MDEEISRYIEFYNWVYERIGQIVIADFDQVINDFNVIIKDINYQYDKLFLLLDNVKKADIQVKNDIEKRYDELGKTKMSHIKPVPTDGRNIEKEKHHDDVLIHNNFFKVKKLYEDIVFLIRKIINCLNNTRKSVKHRINSRCYKLECCFLRLT